MDPRAFVEKHCGRFFDRLDPGGQRRFLELGKRGVEALRADPRGPVCAAVELAEEMAAAGVDFSAAELFEYDSPHSLFSLFDKFHKRACCVEAYRRLAALSAASDSADGAASDSADGAASDSADDAASDSADDAASDSAGSAASDPAGDAARANSEAEFMVRMFTAAALFEFFAHALRLAPKETAAAVVTIVLHGRDELQRALLSSGSWLERYVLGALFEVLALSLEQRYCPEGAPRRLSMAQREIETRMLIFALYRAD